MNLLDMKTVILSYIISNAICMMVVFFLCIQNRRRFEGLGFWLADFVLQFVALVLVVMRGVVPDIVSMTLSNALIIGGTVFLYAGLERFVGKRGSQIHNIALLTVYILSHAYFVVHPNLGIRNIILSLGLLAICAQCAWLMLRRVNAEMHPLTKGIGILFVTYCLVSLARVFLALAIPPDEDFFKTNMYDTSLVMLYQMLFIILTFNLFLMVNRRLIGNLELDIAARKQAEVALKESEQKFRLLFETMACGIVYQDAQGQITLANPAAEKILGLTLDQMQGRTSIDPRWRAIHEDGSAFSGDTHPAMVALRTGEPVSNTVMGVYNLQTDKYHWININAMPQFQHGEATPYQVYTTFDDITERKRAETVLRESEWRYRTVADFTHDWEFWLGPDGNYVYISPACERISGYAAAEFHAAPGLMQEIIHLDDRALFAEHLAQDLTSSVSSRLEFCIVTRAGAERWIEHVCQPVYAQDGSWLGRRGSNRDITERKQADEVFQIRLKLFEFSSSHSLVELMQKALDEIGAITNSPIGFYHFVEADQQTLSLQAWSTRTLEEFCHAEGKGMHYPVDQAGVWTDCIRERKPVIHNDYSALTHRKGLPPGHAEVVRELVVPILRGGQIVSILGVGNKSTDYNERDVHLVVYIADAIWEIVERKRVEEKLQQLSRAVEQSPASIVITDTTGRIEYVNPRFTQVTGYSAEEAVGQNPRILKTELTPKGTHRELWETVAAGKDWQGEFVNRKKNGEIYYELASISPILDAHGSITHYVAVKENITERKESQLQLRTMNDQLAEQVKENLKLQEILREQAIRDPLTGLYNRRYLDETIGRELARAEREEYAVSFVMVDVDHFKHINDTFGHDAGDAVLQQLAARLLSQTRVGDIVCRYGGEEFLAILPNVTAEIAFQITERWRSSFLGSTLPFEQSKIKATISCGISEYPAHGSSDSELITLADKAMYQAKNAGRNRVHVWGVDCKSDDASVLHES